MSFEMPDLEPEILDEAETPPEALETPTPEKAQENIKPEAEKPEQQPGSKLGVDQIASEEVGKRMEGEEAKVKIALSELFELLPHGRKTDKKEILSLIELTALSNMVEPVQEMLANRIMKKKLYELPKAKFIKAGLEELALQIRANAMMAATNTIQKRLKDEDNKVFEEQTEKFKEKEAA